MKKWKERSKITRDIIICIVVGIIMSCILNLAGFTSIWVFITTGGISGLFIDIIDKKFLKILKRRINKNGK